MKKKATTKKTKAVQPPLLGEAIDGCIALLSKLVIPDQIAAISALVTKYGHGLEFKP